MRTDIEEVGVEDICVELFKISNKLRILSGLARQVVQVPPTEGDPGWFIAGVSRDLQEFTTEFLQIA